jgi:hypothetical protein
MDIWMNQCIKCCTHNPSEAGHKPTKCAGCGTALEVVRQLPGEADGLWRIQSRMTDEARKKWQKEQEALNE